VTHVSRRSLAPATALASQANEIERQARESRAAQPSGRAVGSDIFFPVAKRDLAVIGKNGPVAIRGIDRFQATVRIGQGGEPVALGVVGMDYEVVPMRRVVEQAEEALLSILGENLLADAKIVDRMAYQGAFVSREYVLPTRDEVKPRDRKVGDIVAFKVVIVNSYDGSGSVGLQAGTEILRCTNGMVSFSSIGGARKRHTSSTRHFDWGALVRTGLDSYQNDIRRMRVMAEHGLDAEQAEAALKAAGVAERAVNRIVALFNREREERGDNVWALANALSFDATHREFRNTGTDHAAATLLERQAEASRILDVVLRQAVTA
jgi:hypothetical protein